MAKSPGITRRLILLGSTGSIGTNTLEVIQHLNRVGSIEFDVVGLAAGSNSNTLAEQAKSFQVDHVAIADHAQAEALGDVATLYTGPDAAVQLIQAIARPGDLVVGAMVGSAGLPATLEAIELGCDIALANKETLVAAGEMVMPLVKAKGVNLLPIDSEHSAIFQCLLSGRSIDEVRRLVITASGGPFRTWSKTRIAGASPQMALDHPTWNMGPKVTIDSASLMNKSLEVIEAHWLFGLPAEKIEVIVHPQSLIHSFVEFVDGSVMAQMGPPDMKTPIQYALTWPKRVEGCSKTMDWSSLRQMDFEPVDHDRFGALQLAYQVIERGGTSGAIFNAANEVAVQAFLDGRIDFPTITNLVGQALSTIDPIPVHSLDDVMKADQAARVFVHDTMKSVSSSPKSANPAASAR
ncbi:MAG: 1-deoxy-D-xylulose-5-phosphate reductoisomerase [Planctomycetota bacterium]|nr:1-deoxy-D-xylulose-5-phosphate reductoisomerase [Planctomycetota bacterium]